MKILSLDGLSFELHRSPRRRTVEINVDRGGGLVLACPTETAVDELAQVVRQRRLWIYSRLAEKEALFTPRSPKEYVSGEGFLYLGRSYRLKVVAADAAQPPLRLYQSRFELRRDAQAEGRGRFVRWFTTQLERRVPEQVSALASRVGSTPRSIHVRDLGFRWGSCGRKGDLYVHWRAAMLPLTIIEYIVAHEMVHLVCRRHNERFWQRLERLVPDCLERGGWLAAHGAAYSL